MNYQSSLMKQILITILAFVCCAFTLSALPRAEYTRP